MAGEDDEGTALTLGVGGQKSRVERCGQGRQDLNLQPPVLENGRLPLNDAS
jgi:hypothetical protein